MPGLSTGFGSSWEKVPQGRLLIVYQPAEGPINHSFASCCDMCRRPFGLQHQTGECHVNLRRFAVIGTIAIASVLPVSCFARPAVALDSAVFVERVRQDGEGTTRRLEQASTLKRGERIVGVVTWYRMGGNGGFTVTNALPRGVYYQGSAADREEVSVDGGRSWGQLGTLRAASRLATAEDVTHVRWHVPATSAARGQGRIAYSGIVR